ncbi:MAG: glycoside hydrolase N-terminal domain-containing protein [Kiritimatiellae bacterium]|nr:glycoside hydrolase N-terminal domain-containing protein [Kiritimatiellia bacterium]
MKSRFAIRAAAAASAAMSLACAAGPAGGMELWYRSEAKDWVEALPVGNGRLGAMAFGGVGLRAQGGFVVDIEWKGGEPVLVRVKSLAGVPCRVRYAGKEVSLYLKKGEAWEGR